MASPARPRDRDGARSAAPHATAALGTVPALAGGSGVLEPAASAPWLPWVLLGAATVVLLGLALLRHYLDQRARLTLSETRQRHQEVTLGAELLRSEQLFRAAFDDAMVGMSLVSPSGHYVRVNAVFAATLGRTVESLTGASVAESTHPDDLGLTRAAIARLLAGEVEGFRGTKRYVRPDGSVVHVELSAALIRDADGQPQRIVTQTVDVTDRHRAERERDRHLGMLRSVLAGSQSLIYVKDLDGRYLMVNEPFERAYGVTEAELLGKDDSVLDPDLAPAWRANDLRARSGTYRVEEWSDGANGRTYYDSVKLPLFDGDGTLYATCGVSLDVTAARQAAEAMARARDAALAATDAKSAFLATMSHEIRTPMNAVIGLTGLLLDTRLDDEQRELVETVRDSGESLLTVINDILDFSKIESGDLQLDLHPFDLRECVDSALAVVTVSAGEKELELVADIDESCPTVLGGDATRFRQVLVNLLGNAVKFTPAGEVVLSLSAQPAPAGSPAGSLQLRVSIRDTGIGIPADRMDRLFVPFSQIDGSTTRLFGGTGLGLAISRRLVEAMGGSLTATSEVGVGSTFAFTVLMTEHPDRRVREPDDGRRLLVGASVLLAYGNPHGRRALERLLVGWGASVTAVAGPGRAMDELRGPARFDVAVLDQRLPGPDAVQLAGALRELTARRQLPLLLISSPQSRVDDEHRSLFAGRLTKPVRSQLLREKLREALHPGEAAMTAVESAGGRRLSDPPALGHRPLRILVAEDNPTNQVVARLMLDKLGHHVDTVANGREAVLAVHRAHYDVVLMDVQMPELDGIAATRQIRAELPERSQPRIAAMTASALVTDRNACAAAGMDDYLAKPIRTADLARLLADLVP